MRKAAILLLTVLFICVGGGTVASAETWHSGWSRFWEPNCSQFKADVYF